SEHQLSLAIGKEGQNARLAARLTGYRIDIRSDEPPPSPGAEAGAQQSGAGVAASPVTTAGTSSATA
ncbi:MAG: transcription termination/antitermination protein NusA, partial [bacterium]|nr:transcription termination/antitermination protein NusA [bacterium]